MSLSNKGFDKRLVYVTTELSPELAEKFYEVVNNKFEGDHRRAVSQAIKLLLSLSKDSRI